MSAHVTPESCAVLADAWHYLPEAQRIRSGYRDRHDVFRCLLSVNRAAVVKRYRRHSLIDGELAEDAQLSRLPTKPTAERVQAAADRLAYQCTGLENWSDHAARWTIEWIVEHYREPACAG
jgi:hypothetical protein